MKYRWMIVVWTWMMLSGTLSAQAQWATDPAINNAIATATNIQEWPTLVSDGAGGAIITWQDLRGGTTDIYAQRINANGVAQWLTDGVPISIANHDQYDPAIVSDGAGGAIITWHDGRSGTYYDIYAQRINANGIVQWATDGVPVSTAIYDQRNPAITSDGAGGAIITWADSRNGLTDIYTQRISASGAVQWTMDGVPISTASNDQTSPRIVSDGASGAIITWADSRSGGGASADIYAQRISETGVVQWATHGLPISTATNRQRSPTLVSDGVGGAIITWTDMRSGTTEDIYAQRVNASGVVQWVTDGIPISTASNHQSEPAIDSDEVGGAIITWHDRRSGFSDIYAQRINANGSVQWTTDGAPISTANGSQNYPALVGDGAGGTIITWHDDRNGSNADIYAQRVNANGVAQWTSNGVPISTASNNQLLPTLVSNSAGGAIITWRDNRNSASGDIYVQRVRSDGTLGSTVLTPGEELQSLKEQIEALIAAGVLTKNGNGLIAQINKIMVKLNAGKVSDTITQLRDFIEHVTSLIATGVLTPAQGQPLIDGANRVLVALGG